MTIVTEFTPSEYITSVSYFVWSSIWWSVAWTVKHCVMEFDLWRFFRLCVMKLPLTSFLAGIASQIFQDSGSLSRSPTQQSQEGRDTILLHELIWLGGAKSILARGNLSSENALSTTWSTEFMKKNSVPSFLRRKQHVGVHQHWAYTYSTEIMKQRSFPSFLRRKQYTSVYQCRSWYRTERLTNNDNVALCTWNRSEIEM